MNHRRINELCFCFRISLPVSFWFRLISKVREELLKFHSKWYSSNLMTLAVLGQGISPHFSGPLS